MEEKLYGKDFGLSFFPSPDLNPETTTRRGLIFQDILNPSSGRTDSGQQRGASPAPASFLSALNSPFDADGGAGGGGTSSLGSLLDPFMKKRGFEETELCGDRRYKRMMKNRESAARSRSRRLAYTFELEKKKSQLTEENAKLRRVLQGQELFSAAAAAIEAETPRKRDLCRTLSAPF